MRNLGPFDISTTSWGPYEHPRGFLSPFYIHPMSWVSLVVSLLRTVWREFSARRGWQVEIALAVFHPSSLGTCPAMMDVQLQNHKAGSRSANVKCNLEINQSGLHRGLSAACFMQIWPEPVF